MAERTFGWIQNPSSFKNLKNVVSVFDFKTDIHKDIIDRKITKLIKDKELRNNMLLEMHKRPLKMDYVLLKGHGILNGESRSNAKCSGIIQAAIKNQKGREYTDDWTADGFLRWAISIGLLDYDVENDQVSLTELGGMYVNSDSEEKDNEIIIVAILT